MATLVGADMTTLTHLDLRTGHEVALMWPPERADPRALSGYPALADSHPLRLAVGAALRRGEPIRRPIRISDLLSARQWRATAIRAGALRDVADQMSLPLRTGGSVVTVLSLGRAAATFTDRQRDLLDAGTPHLRAALGRAAVDVATEAPAFQLAPWPGWVPAATAPGLRTPAPPRTQLSTREHQVLELVARGLTDAQIAQRLALRPATVSKHLHRMYRRLGVANRAEAALRWQGRRPATGRAEGETGVGQNGRCGQW
jgi:DNA-binding CsgD family transcriptional regulator